MSDNQERELFDEQGRECIGQETAERLKALGFDPGINVYEIPNPGMELELVKRALFDSSYTNPVVVTFRDSRPALSETPIGYGFPMVVEMAQAVYVPREANRGSGQFGCYNRPSWYLRGFLIKSGFDPYPEVIRMHAYLETGEDPNSNVESALVQVVRASSGADPSTALVYAKKPPREEGD